MPERLVLLARIDGATDKQVRRLFRWASLEDAQLVSPRMHEALAVMQANLCAPFATVPTHTIQGEHFAWANSWGPAIELTLAQYLFADVAVSLVGEAVAGPLASLSLQQRLMLYSLIVDELNWLEVERLFGVSEHEIRKTIKAAIRLQGGV